MYYKFLTFSIKTINNTTDIMYRTHAHLEALSETWLLYFMKWFTLEDFLLAFILLYYLHSSLKHHIYRTHTHLEAFLDIIYQVLWSELIDPTGEMITELNMTFIGLADIALAANPKPNYVLVTNSFNISTIYLQPITVEEVKEAIWLYLKARYLQE